MNRLPILRVRKGDCFDWLIKIGCIKLIPHSGLYDVEYRYILEQLLTLNDFDFRFESFLLPESRDKLVLLKRAYENCDYIISSRWHGNIIASALGIPNISLGIMLKQQALNMDLGITNYDQGFADLQETLFHSKQTLTFTKIRVQELRKQTEIFSQAVADILCH